MDPITGISLAASIVQLVQFGISSAKAFQEIYQHGSTTELASAEVAAGLLASLTNSVQQSLHNTNTHSGVLSAEEKELIDLARKCEDCANKLQFELRKLQAQPQVSHLKAVRKAARSIWKKNTIVKIQEELENYRRILETSLLYRISQRFDAQTLTTTESFAKLNQNLRHVISSLASSQTSLDTLVKQESNQTRQQIDTQVARLEQFHIDGTFSKDLIKSLFYPEISSRQEQVASEFYGFENSYEWVFEEPTMKRRFNNQFEKSQRRLQWASFPEWLRSGSNVYWMNGKAGSGKSTLMNYICDHKRKEELLTQWSAKRRLLTPKFFFWSAGVYLQKTINGLLRSIIYQMLIECRELIACLRNDPILYAWNERHLSRVLFTLLTQTQVPIAICLFIDGLDEFDGRYTSVVETIKSLSAQTNVKVCLSSRPLLDFEKAFAEMPSLRLQDLTFDSISAYADHQLSNLIQERISDSKFDKWRTKLLIDKIVDQAEGVFLWAVVAIRDVREGLQDMADLDELESMIEKLPPGVESLYLQILHRIKPVYRREAIRFLQIVLYQLIPTNIGTRSLDLHMLYFIDLHRVSEDLPLVCNRVDMNAIVGACNALKTRLLSHTLGLLDLVPVKTVDETASERDNQTNAETDNNLILFTKVSLHHRTVKEFLLHNIEAKSFVADAGLKEEHVHLCIARGIFAYLIHLAQDIGRTFDSYPYISYYEILRLALTKVAIVENLVDAPQTKFMRSLHDYSLVPKSLLTAEKKDLLFYSGFRMPYVTHSTDEASMDLIPLAANSGVLRYVCEVLDILIVNCQRSSPTSLLNFRPYLTTENPVVIGLSWITAPKYNLRPSDYRQGLIEHFEWKTDVQQNDRTEANVERSMLVETYLLAGCIPRVEDLYLADKLCFIQILLQAGANPMVRVEPAVLPSFECFWSHWLFFLRTSITYPRLTISSHLVDKRVTIDLVFNTTKALLVHGASVEFKPAIFLRSNLPSYSLKRYSLDIHMLDFEIESMAMFWLERCFIQFPEFRDFAAAVESPMTRPKRKILSIFKKDKGLSTINPPNGRLRAYPDGQESEMLLLLVEKWEESGEKTDRDAMWSAMKRVWRAHWPDILLQEPDKEPDDELDEELDEKPDEELDEASTGIRNMLASLTKDL